MSPTRESPASRGALPDVTLCRLLVGPVRGRAEHRPLPLGICAIERVHREDRRGGRCPRSRCRARSPPSPGADADCASGAQRPARKKPTSGRRPSTLIVAGIAVNQVGGSMIAVSCAGNDADDRAVHAAVVVPLHDARCDRYRSCSRRSVRSRGEPAVRKLAPLVPAPM